MSLNSLSLDEKIAIVLMNLPPAETAQVWCELTPEEQRHFSALYQALPGFESGFCEQVLEHMLSL